MFFKIKAYSLVGLFCFICISSFGQDQKLADSLISVYEEKNFKDEFEILKQIAEYEGDPNIALSYSDLLIKKALKENKYGYVHSGYLQKGNHLQSLGNNSEALEAYFQSENYALLAGNELGKAAVLIAIADAYSELGNHKNAKSYYRRGLKQARTINDSIVLATTLLNAGDEYLNTKQYDSALIYFEESGEIFNKLKVPIGNAYNYGNVGMVYAEQGKDELAEKNIARAIRILEDLEDYYPISVYLAYMSDIYYRKNNISKAFSYAERSLKLAEEYNLKKQTGEAHFKLSELYKNIGDYEHAYEHYLDHISYRDSINNLETVQEMARIRTENEVARKQAEVDLLAQKEKTQKIIAIATAAALLLIGIIAIGLFRRNKFISRTKSIIEKERNRSDQLLLNILPEHTAKELKDSGKVISKRFDSVSVLFADFVGFTKYSEGLSPEKIVDSVDFYFSRFDEIMEKYELEKIKTVGDCYMCAGGLPFPNEDHPKKILLAALEIAHFVEKAKNEKQFKEARFDVRIGINTGPVVAGVVGSKKFAYDIWGDTVNIASRMESTSEAGKINISENTFMLVKDDFICEYRGEIEVKSKGMMKMYYAHKLKNVSSDLHNFEKLTEHSARPVS